MHRRIRGAFCVLGLLVCSTTVAQSDLEQITSHPRVSAELKARFSDDTSAQIARVALRIHDVDPPFYRPIVDDTEAERRQAVREAIPRLRAIQGIEIIAADEANGELIVRLTRRAAADLLQNRKLHSADILSRSYIQNLAQSIGVAKIPEVQSAGYLGLGQKVALIDRSFNATQLNGAVVEERCFCSTGCCPNGQTTQSGSGAANISIGSPTVAAHGTQTASEIAQGNSDGSAPQAQIVAIATGVLDTDVFAALDWLKTRPDIRILSLSIGTSIYPGASCDAAPEQSGWLTRLSYLRNQGVFIVGASGNSGNLTQVLAPACLTPVMGVSGSWSCSQKADFCPPNAAIDTRWDFANVSPAVKIYSPAGPMYLPPVGSAPPVVTATSFASPIAAGCAALLRQRLPNLSPTQLTTALGTSRTWIAGNGYNFPRLDCERANQVAAAPPSVTLDQQGLTGAWYFPTTYGQGFNVEFFPSADTWSGGWFTFAGPAGGGDNAQRWYTIAGSTLNSQVNIYQNVGGVLGHPPITSATLVGTGTIGFYSCIAGTFSFQFNSGAAGTIPLTRLAPNVRCTLDGAQAPSNIDFTYSGNWFNPPSSGQGLILEVNSLAHTVFATWYTYDRFGTSGVSGQRWFTAEPVAATQAGQRTFNMTLFRTVGGAFNQPPTQQTTTAVGTAQLTFHNCGSATWSYSFSSGENAGLNGNISLSRVGPIPAGCQ